MKNYYFIILSIIIIFYIIHSIRSNKLSVTSSFGWMLFCVIMLFLSIFPKSLDWISDLIGITYPPALFLTMCVVLILLILFSYTKKIAIFKKRLTNLEQEVSILKEKQNERQ